MIKCRVLIFFRDWVAKPTCGNPIELWKTSRHLRFTNWTCIYACIFPNSMLPWDDFHFSELSIFVIQRILRDMRFFCYGKFSTVDPEPCFKEQRKLQTSQVSSKKCLPRKRRPSREEKRSSMVARCVPTHQLLRLIWNSTRLFTLEKSSSAASSVNTPSHGLVTSRCTCWHIQEKRLSLARSVSCPTEQLVASKHTCSLTVEKSVSLANSAATSAH